MRKLIIIAFACGFTGGAALAGTSTSTVGSSASSTTTASASSQPGGTAIVTSFGFAATTVSAGPGSASTASFEATQVRGFAVGNASFNGSSQAQAQSFGFSGWTR